MVGCRVPAWNLKNTEQELYVQCSVPYPIWAAATVKNASKVVWPSVRTRLMKWGVDSPRALLRAGGKSSRSSKSALLFGKPGVSSITATTSEFLRSAIAVKQQASSFAPVTAVRLNLSETRNTWSLGRVCGAYVCERNFSKLDRRRNGAVEEGTFL